MYDYRSDNKIVKNLITMVIIAYKYLTLILVKTKLLQPQIFE